MICMDEQMGVAVDGVIFAFLIDIPRQLRLDCMYY